MKLLTLSFVRFDEANGRVMLTPPPVVQMQEHRFDLIWDGVQTIYLLHPITYSNFLQTMKFAKSRSRLCYFLLSVVHSQVYMPSMSGQELFRRTDLASRAFSSIAKAVIYVIESHKSTVCVITAHDAGV